MIIPSEIKKKPFEYLFLVLFFTIGICFYLFAGLSSSNQRFVVISLGAGYFFWSLYHHYHRGDLSLSIIIEYLVFILFGIVLFSGTFF